MNGFFAVPLEGFPRHQALLDAAVLRARFADERSRMDEARALGRAFADAGLPISPLPLIPERDDYWVFEQLLTMDRLLDEEGRPCALSLGEHDQALVCDSRTGRALVDAIARAYELSSPKSRAELNEVLSRADDDAIRRDVGLPPRGRLSLMRPSTYLRLPRVEPAVVHLAGYRQRPDGARTGLLGGQPAFGGQRHLDSLFVEQAASRVGVVLELVG